MKQKEARCVHCFRPSDVCICPLIPHIDNRTSVLILQHRRERFHRFNTARIAHRSLRNSRIIVGYPEGLATRDWQFDQHTGLLYPTDDATLLTEVQDTNRPRQLVMIDGTWHHAKTMFRDIPALRALPCYRLPEGVLGRYRIRREPDSHCLASVEAIVSALRILEPETEGLDALTAAFDAMINRQLENPQRLLAWRSNSRREKTRAGVPRVFRGDSIQRVVVAYGESSARRVGVLRGNELPLVWVAQRLVGGEAFTCTISQQGSFEPRFLELLELSQDDLSNGVSINEFRKRWSAFLRPRDVLAVYYEGSVELLRRAGICSSPHLNLKGAYRKLRETQGLPRLLGDMPHIIAAEQLQIEPAIHPGRAGQRLASIRALAKYLASQS